MLLCELTDPGWTPLFAVVGAAVIDIGGPLSHGAIVAREVGIPCVIGTGDGTRRIADGTLVDVDGDRGEVVAVLSPADDGLHERPTDAPDSWQENCFLLARDDERDLCAYLHVERLHDHVEVKAAVDVAGTTTWHDTHDDWWYEVAVPFERSAVALGRRRRRPRPRSSPPTCRPSTTLRSSPPSAWPAPSATTTRPSGAARGTVTVDGDDVGFDGLFVRDHTWGMRGVPALRCVVVVADLLRRGRRVRERRGRGPRRTGPSATASWPTSDGVAPPRARWRWRSRARPSPAGYTARRSATSRPAASRSCSGRPASATCARPSPASAPTAAGTTPTPSCTWGDRAGFGSRELGC